MLIKIYNLIMSTTINTLDGLRACVRQPYKIDATQFLSAVQRGEASIRNMLQLSLVDMPIDVEAIQRELTEGIDQLIGPAEGPDEDNV